MKTVNIIGNIAAWLAFFGGLTLIWIDSALLLKVVYSALLITGMAVLIRLGDKDYI